MSSPGARRPSTRTLLWALLTALIVLYAFPFVYLVLTSFKSPSEAISVPPTLLPSTWSWENYANAFSESGVLASFVNSISTTTISTVLSLVLAVPAAYAVTRFRTPSGRVFILAALVTRMVPPVAVGVPLVGISIPVVLLTLLLQRRIVAGLTLGAVKS
jgi:multiple sugar transport system permease protein